MVLKLNGGNGKVRVMAEEQYIESILMRRDNIEAEEPSFTDEQVDGEFGFKGTIKLVQILKSVQNAQHNRHDYVFKIINIDEIKEN